MMPETVHAAAENRFCLASNRLPNRRNTRPTGRVSVDPVRAGSRQLDSIIAEARLALSTCR